MSKNKSTLESVLFFVFFYETVSFFPYFFEKKQAKNFCVRSYSLNEVGFSAYVWQMNQLCFLCVFGGRTLDLFCME